MEDALRGVNDRMVHRFGQQIDRAVIDATIRRSSPTGTKDATGISKEEPIGLATRGGYVTPPLIDEAAALLAAGLASNRETTS